MYQRAWASFIIPLVLLVAGCSPVADTGPGEIRWDRETCARCNMAIGDRHFAAQVRGAPAAENTRLYKFDDFGCAVVWLQKQPWQDDSRTEIWVADVRNGQWLDARKAVYITDRLSPMNYGLGAVAAEDRDAFANVLDFPAARTYILRGEDERHQHAGHVH